MADNYEIDVTLEEIFGTGISSVEQTVESHEPNGVNEVTVTLTNGQTSVFNVRNGDSSGKPTPVSLVSEMTNPAEIYLYTGSEEGYVKGDIYCYKDNAWTDVGAYGGMLVDDELDADSENAVANKAITEAINEVKADTNALIAAVGSPMVASTVSAMTDHTKIYVYTGTETSYTYGHWYYWNGAYWEDGGVYQSDGLNTDKTLTVPNQAADAQKTGQEISDLKSAIESGSSLTSAIKSALLQLAQKVAYIDEDGQTYYDDLYDALYPPIVVTAITLNTNSLSFGQLNSTQQLTATTTPVGGEVIWSSSNPSVATVSATGLVTAVGWGNATITATSGSVSATCSVAIAQATVTSISAVYTQSGTVYTTDSLDSLKADLVVTATWSNQTTSTVASADYTLSGTLTEGTSTITVLYGGETTTFNVIVSDTPSVAYGVYTPSEIIRGKYLATTGTVESGSQGSCYIPDYIKLATGTTYIIKFANAPTTSKNWTICEYDENYDFITARQIGGSGLAQTGHVSVPTSAQTKYVRLGWYSESTTFVAVFEFCRWYELPMEIGDVSASDGSEVVQPKRLRSDFIPVGTNPVAQGCPFASSWETNATYAWRCYDENKGYLSNVPVLNTTNPTLPTGTAFVRAVMQYANSSHTFTSGWSSEVAYYIQIDDKYYWLTEAE